MAKGYVIAHATVTDPEKWGQYVAKSKIALDKYEGKPIVRGGQCQIMEGTGTQRNVVLEFPSYQAALDCWHSPEYKHAISIRAPISEGDIVIIEGYDGPQPS